MTEQSRREEPVWRIGRSIAMELDMALSGFGLPKADREFPEVAASLVAAVPEDWEAQWPELLGHRRRWVNVLSTLAAIAGVFLEEDYSRATLAMRELTVAGALDVSIHQAAALGVEPDRSLPPVEQLVDLHLRINTAFVQAMGLELASEEQMTQNLSRELTQTTRLLKGGDLHSRFWLWVDRFYFEFYRRWREERLPAMEAQERQAVAELGGREGVNMPELRWLPAQNPLVMRPGLVDSARRLGVPIIFWTEPAGFFDYWGFTSAAIIVSYGQASDYMAGFRTQAAEISERAKALADPTRLAILRLIRHFAMDNTQMADYLGVARPTVSIHSKVLREAGLIDTRQEGRAALHTLNAAEVRRLFQDLERFLRLGDLD